MLYEYILKCLHLFCYYVLADETMYSEDNGWEFITLADQCSSAYQYVISMCLTCDQSISYSKC